MTVTVKGWRVVKPGANPKDEPKRLSRVFTVYAAAEEFCCLAKKAGHITATIETVQVSDRAGKA